MSQDKTHVMGATVLTLAALGASVFPTKISPPPQCTDFKMKVISGVSGVFILPNYSPGINIAGATAFSASLINGYPLNAIGVDNGPYNGPANFYLATIAAATVAFEFRFSASGVTLA
jgi:hypothetical protein